MKPVRVLPLILTLALGACASPDNAGDDAGSGAGGSTGAKGGVSGGTGGAKATGGVTGSGGAGVGTGGELGTGGARGGTSGTGGLPGTGGTTGGTPGTGGQAGAGAGGTKATGGGAGTGGAVGTGGAGGASASPSICKFASGLNVAWVNFASDIPNPDLATFKTIFQNTQAAGGRVVRWWFHTNGTVTPGYDSSGMAQPLTSQAMSDLTNLVNAAHAAGVALNISLWSFDMLQGGENISSALRTNNMNLLTNDANRQAYITNVLTPMVTALKGNPGVYSWEIFNEPEGMTTQHGWTSMNGGSEVDQKYIQRTVNWFAAAIHSADPSARVTSGAQTFETCSSGVANMTNLYSDSALVAQGGKTNGTLDYYEVHYYALNGSQVSCFLNPASHWGLDKNVVMGELYAITTDGVSGANTYTSLYNDGYNGAWAWNYETNDDSDGTVTKWPTMQVPMQNVYNANPSVVGACP